MDQENRFKDRALGAVNSSGISRFEDNEGTYFGANFSIYLEGHDGSPYSGPEISISVGAQAPPETPFSEIETLLLKAAHDALERVTKESVQSFEKLLRASERDLLFKPSE